MSSCSIWTLTTVNLWWMCHNSTSLWSHSTVALLKRCPSVEWTPAVPSAFTPTTRRNLSLCVLLSVWPCRHQRRSTLSLHLWRAAVRIMDLRATAVITLDLQLTSCHQAKWARATTEETATSLSFCSWMLSQLSPVEGRRKTLNNFTRMTLKTVAQAAPRWTQFFCAYHLCSTKNLALYAILVSSDGYYKLTPGCWLDHYQTGKGAMPSASWLQSILYWDWSAVSET